MAWPCKDRRLRIAAANIATTTPAGLVPRLDVNCHRNCHAGYYTYITVRCQGKNGLLYKDIFRKDMGIRATPKRSEAELGGVGRRVSPSTRPRMTSTRVGPPFEALPGSSSRPIPSQREGSAFTRPILSGFLCCTLRWAVRITCGWSPRPSGETIMTLTGRTASLLLCILAMIASAIALEAVLLGGQTESRPQTQPASPRGK